MSNSKFKCSGCKNYFPMFEVFLQNGPTRFCSSECVANTRFASGLSTASESYRKPRVRKPGSDPTEEQRAKVYLRDVARCRRCGTLRDLHVHHIHYRSEHWPDLHAPHNLIVLCRTCHDVVHSDKGYWQPVLLAYIWLRYVEGRSLFIGEVERIVEKMNGRGDEAVRSPG